MGDLSKDFSRSEFACKCGCGFDAVKPYLVEQLQKMRDQLGFEIIVESGCRCSRHNAEVNGAVDSSHLTGEAADLKPAGGKPWGSEVRFRFMEAALAARFKRVGIGETIFHVDISTILPWPRLWLYEK